MGPSLQLGALSYFSSHIWQRLTCIQYFELWYDLAEVSYEIYPLYADAFIDGAADGWSHRGRRQVANEFLVEKLANSPSFQRFAMRVDEGVTSKITPCRDRSCIVVSHHCVVPPLRCARRGITRARGRAEEPSHYLWCAS